MAEDLQSKYPTENDTEYGSPPPYSDQDTHHLTAPAAAPQPASMPGYHRRIRNYVVQ